MPYVPSEKTNPPAEDRKILDAAVEPLARKVASEVTNNFSIISLYKCTFWKTTVLLRYLVLKNEADREGGNSLLLRFLITLNCLLRGVRQNGLELELAKAICETGAKYGYEGAFLGELNYAFTRFIQRVPQIIVATGKWKDELRYWLYAATVSGLIHASRRTEIFEVGIDGVFEDIKDEYKRRVNPAYEAAQIIKSGDCYDTPYYGRLVEVVDENGKLIGHMEVWLKRSPETLHLDVLQKQIVLKEKK